MIVAEQERQGTRGLYFEVEPLPVQKTAKKQKTKDSYQENGQSNRNPEKEEGGDKIKAMMTGMSHQQIASLSGTLGIEKGGGHLQRGDK